MKALQNRFKSPILWASLVSAVILILKGFGIIEIDDATTNTIISIFLSILTALGIVNNPSDSAKL